MYVCMHIEIHKQPPSPSVSQALFHVGSTDGHRRQALRLLKKQGPGGAMFPVPKPWGDMYTKTLMVQCTYI